MTPPKHSLTLSNSAVQQVYNLLPTASPGHIYLVAGPVPTIGPLVQELAHHFAIRGLVRVLLGGNRFSLERLPLLLGARTHQLYDVLDRMHVSRGETCYQLLHALQNTPNRSAPLFVLDMLETFYEEGLTEAEVRRVLQDCIHNLRRLSTASPVLLSASGHSSRPELLENLLKAADHCIELEPATADSNSPQLALFPEF